MENDAVYPSGWKHRTFFGSRNGKDKKPRVDSGDSMEQQVLMEQELGADMVRQDRQRREEERKVQQLEQRMSGPAGTCVVNSA